MLNEECLICLDRGIERIAGMSSYIQYSYQYRGVAVLEKTSSRDNLMILYVSLRTKSWPPTTYQSTDTSRSGLQMNLQIDHSHQARFPRAYRLLCQTYLRHGRQMSVKPSVPTVLDTYTPQILTKNGREKGANTVTKDSTSTFLTIVILEYTYLETQDQRGDHLFHLDPGQVSTNADPLAMQKREARLLHLLPMRLVGLEPSLRAEHVCIWAVDSGVTGGVVRRYGDIGTPGDLDPTDEGVVGCCSFRDNT